jgi:hypothetical protein
MARYTPPRQSKIGQVIDVLVLLVLTVGALYVPLLLGLAGGAKQPVTVENPTWETLKQNPVMVEKWNALGYTDPAAVSDMITARYDYWGFSTWEMILMVVVVVGYFVTVVRLSGNEYKEVIAEKFGDRR